MNDLFKIGLILCYLFFYSSSYYIQMWYPDTYFRVLLIATTDLTLNLVASVLTSDVSMLV